MEHALSPATLSELRRPRAYPAVSVLTPTHRREPENTQDPVRLRNVVAEAKKQLESDPAVPGSGASTSPDSSTRHWPRSIWRTPRTDW